MEQTAIEWTQATAERWLIEYARSSPFPYDERIHGMLREQGNGTLPEWPAFLTLLDGSHFRTYCHD